MLGNRRHSKELWALATNRTSLKVEHLERCLLPHTVQDAGGNIAATRPSEYDPPPP